MDENNIDENYVQIVSRLYIHFMGELERRGRIDVRTGLLEFLVCEFKNGKISKETLFKAQEDLAWLMRDDDKIMETAKTDTLDKTSKISDIEDDERSIHKLNFTNQRKNQNKSSSSKRKLDTDFIERIMVQRGKKGHTVNPSYSNTNHRKAQIFDLSKDTSSEGGSHISKSENGEER